MKKINLLTKKLIKSCPKLFLNSMIISSETTLEKDNITKKIKLKESFMPLVKKICWLKLSYLRRSILKQSAKKQHFN